MKADVHRAAKAARERRERRFYTPDRLGLPCHVCGNKVPKALNEAGVRVHPTCGPSELVLLQGGRY